MFEAWEWGTYIFFAVFLASGIFWVWFFLPETKGATLEEMDNVFKSHTGAEDAAMLAEARRDVGISPDLEVNAIRATGAEDFTHIDLPKHEAETVEKQAPATK